MRLGRCLTFGLMAFALEAQGEGAIGWLEKMSQADRNVSFTGTFVLVQEDELETVQIFHGLEAGGMRERLVTLSGEAREIVRDHDIRTCVSPEHETVVVERVRERRGLTALSPEDLGDIADYYQLSEGDAGRVAGRDCRWIDIRPRDEFRYGFRVCVDRESGVALNSAVLNQGRPVERMVFTAFEVVDRVPAEVFEATLIRTGFTWYKPTPVPQRGSDDVFQNDIIFKKLPPGFRVSDNVVQAMAALSSPVRHIVITDGLASVSVFVSEQPTASDSDADRYWKSGDGATHSMARINDGHRVTVVGEVPAQTVELIARNVSVRPLKASQERTVAVDD